jgi:hypothetical protein
VQSRSRGDARTPVTLSLSKGALAAIAACLLCASVASAAIPAGAGQTIFTDVPVAPGSYPDRTPSPFVLRAGAHAHPQAFNYGDAADAHSIFAWYRRRLPQLGWQVGQVRRNYPTRGADAIVASRKGEAVTIVVTSAPRGSKISVIKLVSTK